ncbi:hypothetical protein BS47DRAFT_1360469 [Hydnum rufescens UP504]|uniref:Uncharacterized protein n=1 Tax=Hydnum rufescens UP504 TaxID=1448309 RepID=A0A9P6B1W7_9AGAM|nr:hypothetical protein BS47DRAFT_1360469 [Hydnum rufescens UP504]
MPAVTGVWSCLIWVAALLGGGNKLRERAQLNTRNCWHLSTFWILAIPGVELCSFSQLVTTTQQGSHPDKTQPHTCHCGHVVTRHSNNSPNEAPNGNRQMVTPDDMTDGNMPNAMHQMTTQ